MSWRRERGPSRAAGQERAAGPDVLRPVFELRDLTVEFGSPHGPPVRVVEGVDLQVRPGETLGVVGESGVGKSVTMLAALRLLPEPPARIVSGRAVLDGTDLLAVGRRELRSIRGRDVGVVFQDPLTALHPSFRIGDQIAEAVRVHHPETSRHAARERAVELLDLVGVPRARRRWRDYPHQWSGGMRQRAVIAIAIANGPKLLVADEPTTALDVTIQAQVLGVLRDIQRRTGTAMIVITHDLGVIAELADTVSVMAGGRVVETGDARDVFRSPRLPYTASLLLRRPPAAPSRVVAPGSTGPVLEARDVVTHFPDRSGGRRSVVHAVDGVSFALAPGEALGLVGESGCGKSTLARTVVRLLAPTSGRIRFEGNDITTAGGSDLQHIRARLRIVFQDPFASLNPRRSVGDIVAEPLRIHGRYGAQGEARVRELFELVGLDPRLVRRFPHEFSGGQRQRIGIARALALEPRVLVLDEPVSSLDVPIQVQIIDLLAGLQRELGLAYLFVSHDLAVVRQLCQRVAVMYLGRLVEVAETSAIFERPAHPYTRALLSAVPVTDPADRGSSRRIVLAGDPPDPTAPPQGCNFNTRCWERIDRCEVDDPQLLDVGGDRTCACHLVSSRPDGDHGFAAPMP